MFRKNGQQWDATSSWFCSISCLDQGTGIERPPACMQTPQRMNLLAPVASAGRYLRDVNVSLLLKRGGMMKGPAPQKGFFKRSS